MLLSGKARAKPGVAEGALEPAAPCLAHSPPHRFVGEQTRHGSGDGFRILSGHEEARLPVYNDVRGRVVSRAKTRDTQVHGLQVHETEAFAATRHREDRRVAHDATQRRVGKSLIADKIFCHWPLSLSAALMESIAIRAARDLSLPGF